MDPSNQVLFKRSNEVHGIMDFKTTTPGKYTFIFSNLDDWNDRTVTFALHTFEEKEEQILFDINEEGEREVVFDPRLCVVGRVIDQHHQRRDSLVALGIGDAHDGHLLFP